MISDDLEMCSARGVEFQSLRKGERRIAEVLARHHPMKMTKSQLGMLSKFSIKGGTFLAYLGILKRQDVVEQVDGLFGLTVNGRSQFDVCATPMGTEEILDMWRNALRAGERNMLNVLIEVYPKNISKTDLAEQVDMTVTGGTFLAYLGTLKRNSLASVVGGSVIASESLFMGSQ